MRRNARFENKGLDIEFVSKKTHVTFQGFVVLILKQIACVLSSDKGRYLLTMRVCDRCARLRSIRLMKIRIIIHIIHDNLIRMHYARNTETPEPPDYVSPIAAACITAHAKVRLAKFLTVLQPSQVLYCDHDS